MLKHTTLQGDEIFYDNGSIIKDGKVISFYIMTLIAANFENCPPQLVPHYVTFWLDCQLFVFNLARKNLSNKLPKKE